MAKESSMAGKVDNGKKHVRRTSVRKERNRQKTDETDGKQLNRTCLASIKPGLNPELGKPVADIGLMFSNKDTKLTPDRLS